MNNYIKLLFTTLKIVMGLAVLAFSAIVLDIRCWNAVLWILASGMLCMIAWSVRELIRTVKSIRNSKHP